MPLRIYTLCLPVVFGFYLFSLSQDAIIFENHRPAKGFDVLVFGWGGIFNGDIAWYANALLSVSVLLNLAYKPILGCQISFLSILVALAAPCAETWSFFNGASRVPIVELGPAYVTWLTSLILNFVASAVVIILIKKTKI